MKKVMKVNWDNGILGGDIVPMLFSCTGDLVLGFIKHIPPNKFIVYKGNEEKRSNLIGFCESSGTARQMLESALGVTNTEE
jgi:hypothetical protein